MPLDYLNTTDNRTVAIAVLKVPATVDVTDPAYGGTLMVNPGGPGDSGIVHMLKNGRYIQSQIDGDKHYEVLSFDLRGVAYSTPRADCYSNEAAREAATWQSRGLGDLDSSDEGLKKHLVLSKAYGYQCARYRDEGVDFNIHEYTSTASIARDMLRLVDETEALRQKKLQVRTAAQVPLGGGNKESRLMYYGTSYGTILGNTFLSMFPGRVRRMMLDGVVVPESWIHVVSFPPGIRLNTTDGYRTGAAISEIPEMQSTTSTRRVSMPNQTVPFGKIPINLGTTSNTVSTH